MIFQLPGKRRQRTKKLKRFFLAFSYFGDTGKQFSVCAQLVFHNSISDKLELSGHVAD